MDVGRPYGLITGRLDSPVLYVLAGTDRPLTGREVARIAPEGSQQGIGLALSRLVETGLVERQDAGSAALYTLNRRHLAAAPVVALVSMRRRLIEGLRQQLAGWSRPALHASMFGSAARGDGDSRSDIDLFVVRPAGIEQDDSDWREQLELLSDNVLAWIGNFAGVVEVTEADLPQLRHNNPPVLESLRADAITLYGEDINHIL